MKCKQPRLGFELGSQCPFTMMVTISPGASLSLSLSLVSLDQFACAFLSDTSCSNRFSYSNSPPFSIPTLIFTCLVPPTPPLYFSPLPTFLFSFSPPHVFFFFFFFFLLVRDRIGLFLIWFDDCSN